MAAMWRLVFFQLNFFFRSILKPGRPIYRFSGFASLLESFVFMGDRNEATAAFLILLILINRSYFQLNALKPDIIIRHM